MSCSWDVIFTIDKKTISIRGWGCDNNFPMFRTVDPQKSFTYNIPILIEKTAITSNYTFRIGMYLFKYGKHSRDFDAFLDSFDANHLHSKKPFYEKIMWSNEVSIPK